MLKPNASSSSNMPEEKRTSMLYVSTPPREESMIPAAKRKRRSHSPEDTDQEHIEKIKVFSIKARVPPCATIYTFGLRSREEVRSHFDSFSGITEVIDKGVPRYISATKKVDPEAHTYLVRFDCLKNAMRARLGAMHYFHGRKLIVEYSKFVRDSPRHV